MTTSRLNNQNIGETSVTHADMIKRKNTLSFYKNTTSLAYIYQSVWLCVKVIMQTSLGGNSYIKLVLQNLEHVCMRLLEGEVVSGWGC